MIVIVCGGRTFTDEKGLYREMDKIHAETPITLVVEGGQRTRKRGQPTGGADYWAFMWASSRNVAVVREDADWNNLDVPDAQPIRRDDGTFYNKNAGRQRNQRMIDKYNPAAVIALPGGNGTANMKHLARAAGIKVIEIKI